MVTYGHAAGGGGDRPAPRGHKRARASHWQRPFVTTWSGTVARRAGTQGRRHVVTNGPRTCAQTYDSRRERMLTDGCGLLRDEVRSQKPDSSRRRRQRSSILSMKVPSEDVP